MSILVPFISLKLIMKEVTLLPRIAWVRFGFQNKPISEIFEIIRNGDFVLPDLRVGTYSVRDITEAIRSQTNENVQNEWKALYLPVVTFNGLWDGYGICQYSRYTALDFDNISSAEECVYVKERLMATPCVMAIFHTLKPNHLKAIILHDNQDPTKHQDLYGQLMRKFGLELLDQSCKDLSRRHYLVWDENIWVNPNPSAYHYIPSPLIKSMKTTISAPASKTAVAPRSGKQKSPFSIVNIFKKIWNEKRKEWEFWHEGIRNNRVFSCACLLCEYGVPQEMAENLFVDWVENGFDKDEILKHVEGAYKYKRNEFNTKIFIG